MVDLGEKLRDGKEPFTLHPAVSFCVQQYLLSIAELLLRLEKRKVSYRNFRELAENLAGLLETYHVKASTDEGARIASVVSRCLVSKYWQESWSVYAYDWIYIYIYEDDSVRKSNDR